MIIMSIMLYCMLHVLVLVLVCTLSTLAAAATKNERLYQIFATTMRSSTCIIMDTVSVASLEADVETKIATVPH
jgi:hypothetical protein